MFKNNLLIIIFALVLISLFKLPVFAEDSGNAYINTHAATIIDSKNQKTLIYKINYGKGIEKFLEFHGYRGATAVVIPFTKVKSVEVLGKVLSSSNLYSSPYVDTIFHLADGHAINVSLPADFVWRGETAYGEITVATEDLKVITFNHAGTQLKCPKCGKIFHLEGFKYCPYDGKKLQEFVEVE
jgi:hypothetical protein